jgi:hypothetical protein
MATNNLNMDRIKFQSKKQLNIKFKTQLMHVFDSLLRLLCIKNNAHNFLIA